MRGCSKYSTPPPENNYPGAYSSPQENRWPEWSATRETHCNGTFSIHNSEVGGRINEPCENLRSIRLHWKNLLDLKLRLANNLNCPFFVPPELDTKLLASFFQRSYRDEKPVNFLKAEVLSGARSGENYGSEVFRIKMKFICGSGKIKNRSMIIKTERDWNDLQEFMSAFPLFRTEIRIYTSIFSLMEDLMEEFDDKRENLWPKMYGFLPYHLMALEDLKESQFVVADRKKSLDLKHATIVLRSLARFHAMSKVLIERGLLTKEDKGSVLLVEDGGAVEKMWCYLITIFSDGIRDKWDEKWHDFSDKLRNVADRAAWRVKDLNVNYDPRFEVLAHGDAWLCNMMFRYSEHEDIPVSVRLIDFQLCFATSFITDVSYFMMTSILPSIRRENTVHLLEVYCKALSDNLKFFGYTGYVPNMDDVKSEWKRTQFSHLLHLGLHAILTTEASDAFDPSKIMTHPPHEVFNVIAFTDGKAERSVGEDLIYYHDQGVF